MHTANTNLLSNEKLRSEVWGLRVLVLWVLGLGFSVMGYGFSVMVGSGLWVWV